MIQVGPLVLYVERAVDKHWDRGGARVGPEVSQGVIEPPSGLEQVEADQDQLDIGTLGCCAETLGATQFELGIISKGDQEACEWLPRVGLLSITTARGKAWLITNRAKVGTTRLDPGKASVGARVTKCLGGGELDTAIGSIECIDQRMGPACGGQRGAVDHLPSAVAAMAARSVLPSAMAVLRTSLRIDGPLAFAAAKVAASLAGNALKPTRSMAFSSARLICTTCASWLSGSNRNACLC